MIENRQLITSAIAEKMTKKAKSVLEPQLVTEIGDIDDVESREDQVGENAENLLRTQPRRVMSPPNCVYTEPMENLGRDRRPNGLEI